jgi:hypothetical protein
LPSEGIWFFFWLCLKSGARLFTYRHSIGVCNYRRKERKKD